MSPSPKCVACGAGDVRATGFMVSRRFALLRCPDCRLGFLELPAGEDPAATVDEYWDDVNKVIYTRPRVVEELRSKYRDFFRRVSAPPNRRLLDVGSGAGICVDTARQCGFDAMGVEPSAIGVRLARETYGIEVVHDLLRPDDDLPRDFGVLTLWDVIEHVADPERLLKTCAAHLDGGGYLILETPDEGATARKLVRLASSWIPGLELRNHMYYRAHRYYFTRTAMRELLLRCGFDRVSFYGGRSMYEKAKYKLDMYHARVPAALRRIRKTLFWLMKVLPFTRNKMMVIARRERAG